MTPNYSMRRTRASRLARSRFVAQGRPAPALMPVVRRLMRCATLQVIVAVAVLLPGLQKVLADENLAPFHFIYEKVAITNARTVLSAVLSGDAQSKTNVQALIGSKVVFVGGAAPPGNNANLLGWSNVVVEVELRPSRNVIPRSVYWEAEVLGTASGSERIPWCVGPFLGRVEELSREYWPGAGDGAGLGGVDLHGATFGGLESLLEEGAMLAAVLVRIPAR